MASDVELIPTGSQEQRPSNIGEESIFSSPGFSRPRQPVSIAQARRLLARCGLDGKLILWEDVQRCLDMTASALQSKSLAIQVCTQKPPVAIRHTSWTQDLRDQLQQAQEQLLCEQQAYAKIVLEEEALEADSGWLRQHIQGLLAEKRTLQEEVERLKTYGCCAKECGAHNNLT